LSIAAKSSPHHLGQIVKDTLLLLPNPSFIEGMGRIFDFADTLTQYNRSPTGAEADYYAFCSDWDQIANDMKIAARRYTRNLEVGTRSQPETPS
jgi:hypothetical protein